MRPNGPPPGSGGAKAGALPLGREGRAAPAPLHSRRSGADQARRRAGDQRRRGGDAGSAPPSGGELGAGELTAVVAESGPRGTEESGGLPFHPSGAGLPRSRERPGPVRPPPPARRGTARSARWGRVGARRSVHFPRLAPGRPGQLAAALDPS